MYCDQGLGRMIGGNTLWVSLGEGGLSRVAGVVGSEEKAQQVESDQT